jgi:hypothetical protein
MPERYPPASFVVGIGSSREVWSQERAQREARTNALAEIAAQIRTQVKSSIESVQSESIAGGAGSLPALSVGRTSLNAQSVAHSAEDLEGVEVAERCHEPERGELFVLAVLDRAKYAERARAEITRLDEDVSQLVGAAAGAPPVDAARGLHRAHLLALQADTYRSNAAAVAHAAVPVLRHSAREIQSRLDAVRASQLRVTVSPGPEAAVAAVNRAVTGEGLSVADLAATAVGLHMELSVQPTFARVGGGLHIARVQVSLRLRRSAGGPVEGQAIFEDKAGGQTFELALVRALAAVSPAIEREARGLLRHLLTPAPSGRGNALRTEQRRDN